MGILKQAEGGTPVSELCREHGMSSASFYKLSRAVFHWRFKKATTMSPIQFVKSMRLNNAAMKIAEGKTVSEAAWAVGYQSASQFSREFKRVYGQSPRQWSHDQQLAAGVAQGQLSGPL